MHQPLTTLGDSALWLHTGVKQSKAVVTCEIKLCQHYFSLRRRPSEIVIFQHV